MFEKTIDRSRCDGCGECIGACDTSRVITTGPDGIPVFAKDYKCIFCGHCMAVCPRAALSFHSPRTASENELIADSVELDGGPRASDPLVRGLLAIRSERSFDGREVEKGKLLAVLDAMARAPSAGNEQNWNFYVVRGKGTVDALDAEAQRYHHESSAKLNSPIARKLAAKAMAGKDMSGMFLRNTIIADMPRKEREAAYASLFDDLETIHADGGFKLFRGASAAVIVTSCTNTTDFHKPFHRADVGTAVTYGAIAAASVGLSSCRMGLAEISFGADKKLREKYGIPDGERVDGILALGYSATKWRRLPPRGPVKTIWIGP